MNRFEIEQNLNVDRSFNDYILRLKSSKLEINEYQNSQWDEVSEWKTTSAFSTLRYLRMMIKWITPAKLKKKRNRLAVMEQ